MNERDVYNYNLKLLLLLYLRRRRLRIENERRRQTRRRWWVCPTISQRLQHGAWEHFVNELQLNEPENFLKFPQNDNAQFNWLLEKVQPLIQRRSVVREPIPAGLKLSLTLRFLASGESMVSLSYLYRIGKSTTSTIIAETCQSIWNVLHCQFLAPPTQEGWKKIAKDFNELWNFPNCVGAIDGKHVIVQNFSNSGSAFYNYKGSFSTVLLACDAHYRFILVSIGSAGREGDAGIFQSADFGQCIINERLPLPVAEIFNDFRTSFPAVFVGDAAFPLLKNLMRPFGGTNLPPAETIFNYRLSRARRVVENAFGVLAARFRIFRKPIHASACSVDKIVQASCVLHNWLRTCDIEGQGQNRYLTSDLVDSENQGIFQPGQWRGEENPTGLVPLAGNLARNATNTAKDTRDNLKDFFMTSGQVPWQWTKLPYYQQEDFRS